MEIKNVGVLVRTTNISGDFTTVFIPNVQLCIMGKYNINNEWYYCLIKSD